MLYRKITGDKTFIAIIIFIVALFMWLPSFLSTGNFNIEKIDSQMPLYQVIFKLFHDHILFSKIIAFLLILIQSFLLVRINVRFILIQHRTFLPALFYILLTGYLPELYHLSGVLISSLFLVLALRILFSTHQAEPNTYKLFNAGLVIGLGTLFYGPLVYFIVFVWISNIILRPFLWREYLYPVLGMLTPYAFYFSWIFLSDQNMGAFLVTLKNQLYIGFPVLNMKLEYMIFALYTTLIVLISSIYILKVFQYKKIYIRNYFLLLFWLFVITTVIFMFLSGYDTGLTYIISVPVSYLITNYFITSKKSWTNKILLSLIILGVIVLRIHEMVEWF